MYIMNKNGHEVNPWGTPQGISRYSQSSPSIDTYGFLLDKKDFIRALDFPLNP